MSKQVEISFATMVVQAQPGDTVRFGLTLTNDTGELRDCQLEVSGINGSWFYQFDKLGAHLVLFPDEPGNIQSGELLIAVPADAQPGIYTPEIILRDQRDQTVSASFRLMVGTVGALTPALSLEPGFQQSRTRAALFRWEVVNRLGRPLTLNLEADSARPDLWLQVHPASFELGLNESATGTVEVVPRRRNWIGSDREYSFSLQDKQLPELGQAEGRLVQSCALPWLRRLALTPALLIPALLLPLLIVGLLVFLFLFRKDDTPTSTTLACLDLKQARQIYLQPAGELTEIILKGQPDHKSGSKDQSDQKLGSVNAKELPGLYASLFSFSPEGNYVAYVTALNPAMLQAKIHVLNLRTKAQEQIFEIPANDGTLWPVRPAWDEEGKNRLAYVVLKDKQLQLWKAEFKGRETKTEQIAAPTELTPELFYNDPGSQPLCWAKGEDALLVGATNPGLTKQLQISLKGKAELIDSAPLASPAPLAAAGDCAVKAFSQNDPRWGKEKINPTLEATISLTGCQLTATAMLFNYYKTPQFEPPALNNCLSQKQLDFALDWQSATTDCSAARVQGGELKDFSWDLLNEQLKLGRPTVVGLLGGQTGRHFVVVQSGGGSDPTTYRVSDPWDGTNNKTLDYFVSQGYYLRWLVVYSGADAPPCERLETLQKPLAEFELKSPQPAQVYQNDIFLDYTLPASSNLSVTVVLSSTNPHLGSGNRPALPQRNLQPGDRIEEGAYSLIIKTWPLDNPQMVTTLNVPFIVDKTPPAKDKIEFTPDPEKRLLNPKDAKEPPRIYEDLPVKFKASDELTGIVLIKYGFEDEDPASWRSYPADASPVINVGSRPGLNRLSFLAIDGAGNQSEIQSYSFQRETIRPTPVPTATTGARNGTSPGGPNLNNPGNEGTGNGNSTGEGNSGSSGGSNSGGSGQGSSGGAGSSGGGSPGGTTGPGAVGTLTPSPNPVMFEPDQRQATLQLFNNGTGPLNWTLVPVSSILPEYLRIDQSGLAAPGSSSVIIQLKKYNLGSDALRIAFTLRVANTGQEVGVTVQLNPQPQPSVSFVSPQSGPLPTGKPVTLKLDVRPKGAVVPERAVFFYRSQSGEQAIPGQANEGNNWTVSWNVANLAVQDNLEVSAKICWTSEDATCRPAATLSGLSIAPPNVTLKLSPDSTKLAGTVKLVAQINAGNLDHISYSYTYKDNAKDVTQPLPTPANGDNKFTVDWDTGTIPPQSGIKLTVKACWTADETPETCADLSNQLPLLTVEPPALTVNPLSAADTQSLPPALTLSGGLSKLYNPAGLVWIDYKFSTTTVTTTTPPTGSVQATLNPAANGWTATLDTSTWPPQAVTFSPKVCWNGDPSGPYCYPLPANQILTGLIPDLTAQFVPPASTELARPLDLKVTPAPAGRVSSVKFLVSFSDGTGTPRKDVLLSQNANAAGNWTFTFDALQLGLKSDQRITLKLQACNSAGYCGPLSNPLTLNIPATTLDNFSPTSLSVMTATQTIQATLRGRGVTQLKFAAVYNDPPQATTPFSEEINKPFEGINPDQTISFSWNLAKIPPQEGSIKLVYKFCWGKGELEPGLFCTDFLSAHSGLTIPPPTVTALIINASKPFPQDNSTVLPIAINPEQGAARNTVTFPIQLNLSGPGVTEIRVRYRITDETSDNSKFISIPNKSGGQNITAILSLNLNLDIPKDKDSFTLVFSPVWGSNYEYQDNSKIKLLPIKLLTPVIRLQDGDNSTGVELRGTPEPKQRYLMRKVTKLSLDNPGDKVNHVVFDIYRNNNSPSTLSDGNVPKAAKNDNIWSVVWDHTRSSDQPFLSPQQGRFEIGWRLCGDDSEAACLPAATTGLPRVGGFTLAGVRFGITTTLKENIPFDSTFDATVEIFDPENVVQQVLFYAYPTQADKTQPPSDTNKRVLLRYRPDSNPGIGSANNGVRSVKIEDIFWPSSLPDGIKNRSDDNLTIAIQLCTDMQQISPYDNNIPNDDKCSEWSGTELKQFGSTANSNSNFWKPIIEGKQAVVITWLPFDDGELNNENDPYYHALQTKDAQGSFISSRILRLKIVSLKNGLNITQNDLKFYYQQYSDAARTSFTPNPLYLTDPLCSATWSPLPIRLSYNANVTRNLTLRVEVNYAGTTVSAQIKTQAKEAP